MVERKKLFEELLKEQTEIVCKSSDEILFQFKPMTIINDSLMQGYMTALEKLPHEDCEVLGNFGVGSDKYFFQTPFKVMGDEAVFHLSADVYRLQRRSSMRLHVHQSLGIYLAITEYNQKPHYAVAQIADISAGGARIFFSDIDSPIPASANTRNPGLKTGERFKCVLHLANHKTFDLMAEVKHIHQAVHRGTIVDQLGVEFVELSSTQKNRLMAMTMDLQHRMVAND